MPSKGLPTPLGSSETRPEIRRVLQATHAVSISAAPQKARSKRQLAAVRIRQWGNVIVQGTQGSWDDTRKVIGIKSDGPYISKQSQLRGQISREMILVDVQSP